MAGSTVELERSITVPSCEPNCPDDIFSYLNDDVLLLVLDLISHASPNTLFATSLVSHRMYNLASRYLHRSINIKRYDGLEVLFDRLGTQKGLAMTVHEINFEYSPGTDDQFYGQILRRLIDVFPGLQQLRDFRWNSASGIPLAIVQALELYCFNSRLHVYQWPHKPHSITASPLRNSSRLSTLHANIQYPQDDSESDNRISELAEVIYSCRNLKALEVRMSSPGIVGPADNVTRIEFQDEWKFPHVQDVSIFGFRGILNWPHAIDWNYVRSIDLELDALVAIMSHLTSVESVKVRGRSITREWGDDRAEKNEILKLERLLSQLKPLKELSLVSVGGKETLPSILRHASGLHKLCIHELESSGVRPRSVLNKKDLQELQKTCSDLEELAIDVYRNGEWPYEEFNTLAQFPRLRVLTLNFELGINNIKAPIQPIINMSSAAEVFKYIYSHGQDSCHQRPRTINLEYGSVRKTGFGYLSRWAGWEAANRQLFTATLAERDDERSKGRVAVRNGRYDTAMRRLRVYDKVERSKRETGMEHHICLEDNCYGQKGYVAVDRKHPVDIQSAHSDRERAEYGPLFNR